MRNISLRLCITLVTFIVGVCAYTLWVPEPSTKIDKLELSGLIPPAQPVNSQTNEPRVEAATEPPSPFDPSGDYHPIRQIADESERFVQFALEVRRRKKKLVAWGHVSNVGGWYKFISVSVTEKHLKFRTEKVKSVEYRFEGRFLGSGNFSEQFNGYTGSVMLQGTLQKFLNGQKAFGINTPFVPYPGC